MAAPRERVTPWLTLSVAQGNVVQAGGLLGAAALVWYAGRKGSGGAPWMVASRTLAYFTEHTFSHWLVGRALGIRFTGYGLHGTSHPGLYPPGARFLFSHLPLLAPPSPQRPRRAPVPAGSFARGARGDVLRGDGGFRTRTGFALVILL